MIFFKRQASYHFKAYEFKNLKALFAFQVLNQTWSYKNSKLVKVTPVNINKKPNSMSH